MNCTGDTRQQSQINLVDIPASVREKIYELRTWTCCLQNTDQVEPTGQRHSVAPRLMTWPRIFSLVARC